MLWTACKSITNMRHTSTLGDILLIGSPDPHPRQYHQAQEFTTGDDIVPCDDLPRH